MFSINVSLKDEGYKVQGGSLRGFCVTETLDVEVPEWRRPAVIVVPGGAYTYVSLREGEPIAASFLAKGYQVFVLKYLICTEGVQYPEQLLELASAVDYVKKNAEKFLVNPEEIFVVGFSAGGHLTGNLAVEWDEVEELSGMKLDCKPTAVGLAYPVVTSTEPTHMGSFNNLLQYYTGEEKERMKEKLSIEKRVDENTPPMFIWTTSADTLVPARNSLLLALALADQGKLYELHVYPEGEHGAANCDFETNSPNQPYLRKNGAWIDDCATFFRLLCKEVF